MSSHPVTMSSSETTDGFWEIEPHPALLPYVDHFWIRSARRSSGEAVNILPDGCMDVIVDLNTTQAAVVGTLSRAVLFEAHSSTKLIAARFRPGGAVPFLRASAHELTNRSLEPAALSLPWLQAEELSEQDDPSQAVRALQQRLLQRLSSTQPPNPELAFAITSLCQQEPPTIAELSRTLRRSRQYLRHVFLQEVGISPKSFSRIARLQRAVIQLQASRSSRLSEVAVDLGYFDQAHMARDFRELAGTTPKAVTGAPPDSIFPIRSLFG